MEPLAHVVSKFVLDGKTYEVEDFKTSFSQAVNYNGRPEHEVLGGQLYITLHEGADDNLYLWAKKEDRLKSGAVLFQTDLGMTVLEMNFSDAYCIKLTRSVNAYTGTATTLILSPKEIRMNGVRLSNKWNNG